MNLSSTSLFTILGLVTSRSSEVYSFAALVFIGFLANAGYSTFVISSPRWSFAFYLFILSIVPFWSSISTTFTLTL